MHRANCSHSGKSIAISRVAVRGTAVSRHHGGPIKAPSETPRTLQHYRIEGLKEGPRLGPYYAEKRKVLGQLMCLIMCSFFQVVFRYFFQSVIPGAI